MVFVKPIFDVSTTSGFRGLGQSSEFTKVDSFAGNRNSSNPLSSFFVPPDACNSRLVVLLWRCVSGIFCAGNFAEIANPVVRPVVVYVVDLVGPSTRRHGPYDMVRFELPAKNCPAFISIPINSGKGFFAGKLSVKDKSTPLLHKAPSGELRTSKFPEESSGVKVNAKDFAEDLCGWLRHCVFNLYNVWHSNSGNEAPQVTQESR